MSKCRVSVLEQSIGMGTYESIKAVACCPVGVTGVQGGGGPHQASALTLVLLRWTDWQTRLDRNLPGLWCLQMTPCTALRAGSSWIQNSCERMRGDPSGTLTWQGVEIKKVERFQVLRVNSPEQERVCSRAVSHGACAGRLERHSEDCSVMHWSLDCNLPKTKCTSAEEPKWTNAHGIEHTPFALSRRAALAVWPPQKPRSCHRQCQFCACISSVLIMGCRLGSLGITLMESGKDLTAQWFWLPTHASWAIHSSCLSV